MEGKIAKKVIASTGKTATQVAKTLGMSQQNLSNSLSSADVKSGLIERISSALGISVADFYRRAYADDAAVSLSSNGDHSPNVNGDGNTIEAGSAAIEKMIDTINAQQATIDKQTDIISNLIQAKTIK